MVRSAITQLRAQGFRIVQAVLDESASPRGSHDLAHGGMRRVTELLYLERDTNVPLIGMSSKSTIPVYWRSLSQAHESEFRSLLQATYSSSLDMPELEGVRSLDDVIASHRATGRFIPEYWQFGQVVEEPGAAVILLLAEIPERDAWEVIYLGLTPAARGRGLGRIAVAHALELACPHTSRLELAVDARNTPATRLYQSVGFAVFDRRSVHLMVFPESGD